MENLYVQNASLLGRCVDGRVCRFGARRNALRFMAGTGYRGQCRRADPRARPDSRRIIQNGARSSARDPRSSASQGDSDWQVSRVDRRLWERRLRAAMWPVEESSANIQRGRGVARPRAASPQRPPRRKRFELGHPPTGSVTKLAGTDELHFGCRTSRDDARR